MKKILTGALAALAIGGALAATAVPAAADPYHGGGGDRGGWRGGDRGGWRGGDRDGWRGGDRGGWRGGDRGGAYLGAGLLGLAVGAALTEGYRPSYYAPGYYAPVPRCRVEMRWNPNWGGYDRVRVCY
jgi:hypothetical protein